MKKALEIVCFNVLFEQVCWFVFQTYGEKNLVLNILLLPQKEERNVIFYDFV